MIYRAFDFEVIIIDDNSPDGTIEAAKQLQKIYGDKRIVSWSILLNKLPSALVRLYVKTFKYFFTKKS